MFENPLLQLGIFLILNAFDIITTKVVISKKGITSEVNPLARMLFKKVGSAWRGLILLKVAGILPIIVGLFIVPQTPKNVELLTIVLTLFNVMYAVVCVNNARVLRGIIQDEDN